MTAATRAARALRSGGPRALWFGALGETVYRRLLVLERLLDQPAPPVTAARAVEVMVLEDAAAYRRLRPDQPSAEFARRIASGQVCFAALAGGRVVGATWAHRGGGRCDYLDTDLTLRHDEVYLSDTFVAPELRGQRIAPAIAAAQIAHFRDRAVRRMVATVLPENQPSLRARARMGFAVCGVVGWFGIGGRRWLFQRGLDRQVT